MDLQKTTKTDEPSEKSNFVFFVLLLITIVVIALFAYLKSQDVPLNSKSIKSFFSSKFSSSGGQMKEVGATEFKYDITANPVFSAHQGYIVECTRGMVKYLDTKGNVKWSAPVSVSNPVVKSSGPYLMVADLSGKSLCVFKGSSKQWEKTFEQNILNADISKNGYVTVIHEQNRYRSAVAVFNPEGKEHFTTGKAEYFVLTAKVSPSAKKVALSNIDSSGVIVNSFIEFTDIYGKVLSGKKPVQDMIFPSMWFMKNDSLLVTSDTMAILYDDEYNTKFEKTVKGKIYSSEVALDKYAVLAVTDDGKSGLLKSNKTKITVIDTSGEEVDSYVIDDSVKNITTYGSVIAANTGREVYFITTEGRLIGKYSSKTEIEGVYFLDEQQAVVINKNSVVVTSVI